MHIKSKFCNATKNKNSITEIHGFFLNISDIKLHYLSIIWNQTKHCINMLLQSYKQTSSNNTMATMNHYLLSNCMIKIIISNLSNLVSNSKLRLPFAYEVFTCSHFLRMFSPLPFIQFHLQHSDFFEIETISLCWLQISLPYPC